MKYIFIYFILLFYIENTLQLDINIINLENIKNNMKENNVNIKNEIMTININKNKTHGLNYIYEFNKSKHLMLEYNIYFSKNFDFAKGGKIPGLYGGWDKCSGGRDSSKCFSTRLMWRKNGIGEIYVYLPKQKIKKDEIYHKNYGISLSRGKYKFLHNKWQNIKQEIKLNDINKNNGILKLWIDDQLIIYYKDIIFRKYKHIYIDGIMMQIFYGGCNGNCSPNRKGHIKFSNFKIYNL